MKNQWLVGVALVGVLVLIVIVVSNDAPPPQTPVQQAREALAKRGVKFDLEMFVHSCKEGNLELVALYVAAGINVNGMTQSGETALCVAAAVGHVDVAAHLLDHGANIDQANGQGETPLVLAGLNRQEAVMLYLLQRGAKPLPVPEAKPGGPVLLEPVVAQ